MSLKARFSSYCTPTSRHGTSFSSGDRFSAASLVTHKRLYCIFLYLASLQLAIRVREVTRIDIVARGHAIVDVSRGDMRKLTSMSK